MIEVKCPAELRRARLMAVGTVGFVPTMGTLHSGHFSLIERSLSECDFTVVSIYLNPTQFNNSNDLRNYPKTLKTDLVKLRERKVDLVFLPSYSDLYIDDFNYAVDETWFSQQLCGVNRPGHFKGVLTVVMKLFNILQPNKAYFGEKDYQQLSLIKGMVEAFFLDIEIIGCPTCREADGLAMSSRNLKLSPGARKLAPRFHEILSSARDDVSVFKVLGEVGFRVDYVSTIGARRYGAVILDDEPTAVRLIDNVKING
mgnify:CR=1 FL=1